ncbi:MAG TPA: hypothetical protein VN380_26460 [Thermoanaerobaculia bacterium]|jgi:hypothetical protein|nr:hypothetical protein [Thermoanaerobaculia bacterium]
MTGTDSDHASPNERPRGIWKRILAAFEEFVRVMGPGIVIGYIFGLLIYITCFVIAVLMRPQEWWLNLLLCFFGGIVGWSAGVLLSPVTKSQKDAFAGYGKALSAFVSGFVVAKLEVLLKTFGGAPALYNSLMIGRLLLFGTTFFLGFQFTFVARWKESEDSQANDSNE